MWAKRVSLKFKVGGEVGGGRTSLQALRQQKQRNKSFNLITITYSDFVIYICSSLTAVFNSNSHATRRLACTLFEFSGKSPKLQQPPNKPKWGSPLTNACCCVSTHVPRCNLFRSHFRCFRCISLVTVFRPVEQNGELAAHLSRS
jgi:hypothetical protein